MISLKDYAAQKNISYEAVRKSVARYKDELEGHITVIDRTQYLDDEAVDFLDDKRKKNPVVIIQQDKDAEIDQLRQENEELKNKLLAAQEKIIAQSDRILFLTNENHALLIAGTAQAEPVIQDETAVDADQAHGEELVIDADPAEPAPADLQHEPNPEQDPAEPGFWRRLKYAFTGRL